MQRILFSSQNVNHARFFCTKVIHTKAFKTKSLCYMSPKKIYFTQSNANLYFQNGNELNDLIYQLENKMIAPENIPIIRVVLYKNKYYSLDNRRLAAFKNAGLNEVPVNIVSLLDSKIKKLFDGRFDPVKGDGNIIVIDTNASRMDALIKLEEYGIIKGVYRRNTSKRQLKTDEDKFTSQNFLIKQIVRSFSNHLNYAFGKMIQFYRKPFLITLMTSMKFPSLTQQRLKLQQYV